MQKAARAYARAAFLLCLYVVLFTRTRRYEGYTYVFYDFILVHNNKSALLVVIR